MRWLVQRRVTDYLLLHKLTIKGGVTLFQAVLLPRDNL